MNFNASRNVGAGGGIRKAKRVSDVNAMGVPAPAPSFPVPSYNPTGFSPPPLQFQEAYDNTQAFPYANNPNSHMGDFIPASPLPTATQLGSMMQAPIVQDMALQYGQQLASHGRQVVHRELEKYVPVSKLRYYFAVDTRYVIKKLILIFFPFAHKDWSLKYDQESPVQPRYDLNAPDLYIPSMAYVTYVLLAGFMMGVQHRFSPEQIGAQASRALAYIVLEMAVYVGTLYVTCTGASLKTLDLLAFSSYKYTVMIAAMLAGLALQRTGYYVALVYASCTLAYFLVKTLRVQVLAGPPSGYSGARAEPAGGTKRRVYFLLFVALTQPALSWWLTYDLVPSTLALSTLGAR